MNTSEQMLEAVAYALPQDMHDTECSQIDAFIEFHKMLDSAMPPWRDY